MQHFMQELLALSCCGPAHSRFVKVYPLFASEGPQVLRLAVPVDIQLLAGTPLAI